MMTGKNIYRNRDKWQLVLLMLLSVIFLISGIISDSLVTNYFNSGNVAGRIENVIESKDKFIERIFSKIGDNIAEGRETDLHLSEFDGEDDVAFYFYENDTLRMWSGNEIPVPVIFGGDVLSKGVVFIGNGYYYTRKMIYPGNRVLVAILNIKKDYPYQNDYLQNTFNTEFRVRGDIGITLDENEGVEVKGSDGKALFRLENNGKYTHSTTISWILFLTFFLGFIFLSLALYKAYWLIKYMRSRPVLLFFSFSVDLLILRGVLLYFKIPALIYSSQLFSSYHYASSYLFPSFGDLIVNTFVIFMICWVFYRQFRFSIPVGNNFLRGLVPVIFFIMVLVIFGYVHGLIKSIVIDGNIPVDLSNLFSLNIFSLFSFLIIATLLLSFQLTASRVVAIMVDMKMKSRLFLWLSVIAIAIIVFAKSIGFNPICWLCLAPIIIMACLYFIYSRKISMISFYPIVLFLFFYSLYATYYVHEYITIQEKEDRKLQALKLSVEKDIMAEFMIREIGSSIQNDSTLKEKIMSGEDNGNLESELASYIADNYLAGYLERFEQKVILCNDYTLLEIKPGDYVINCREYFDTLVSDIGELIGDHNLYYLDYGTDEYSYLYRFRFFDKELSDEPVNMFLEIYPRHVPQGLGYPELLIDKDKHEFIIPGDYSYAIYVKGQLMKRVGRYIYGIYPTAYEDLDSNYNFVNIDGFSHLVYKADDNTMFVVSKKAGDLLSIISPFSYFFVLFGLYIAVFILSLRISRRGWRSGMNLRTRLQSSMAFILLVSFLVIGVSSLVYIVKLNANKNLDILSEKAHSVLIEVEHKLSDRPAITPDLSDWLEELMIKFSVVFFTDINLYDLDGALLASSRSQIFSEGLISEMMNASAWEEMSGNKKSLFIQKENIGKYTYLSAYIPFRNNNNDLVAYLNLPYFARENELKKEISGFLVAFINIYVMLIAITIFLALLISGYITKPLQLIREKIRKVRLGKSNEKIEWEHHDEIGNLVSEYNRMVDQLAESAELLARSERELAWREMAKQVAHEIKNPLTPMKLSVQYLKKAWDEGAEDWDKRLTQFSNTIIEQIDSLSGIATEFSDFAQMPKSNNRKIDMVQVIENAISLFMNINNIQIIFNAGKEKEMLVYADDKQMLRVFNNLVKNSIQAIGKKDNGRIVIEARKKDDNYIFSVNDNGSGISKDKAEMIFVPNFTTKSSGKGLGLAMVKNIVLTAGGVIWYESEEGDGATFYFELPVYKEQRS